MTLDELASDRSAPEGRDGASPTERDAAAPPAFPLARRRTKGYARREVDAFLAAARAAFEVDRPTDPATDVTADRVREVSFSLVRGGYQVSAVDAALARIEDAFASRERSRAIEREGAAAWVERQRAIAQEVLDRLDRPRRQRFDRVSIVHYGYRVDEVDLVADRVRDFLAEGKPLSVEQVRQVAFRMQRGGYRETQVDAVLDTVIEVMLAVG